jgi:hypothetical protein
LRPWCCRYTLRVGIVRLVRPFLAPGAAKAAQSCSAYSAAIAFCGSGQRRGGMQQET